MVWESCRHFEVIRSGVKVQVMASKLCVVDLGF